jgi:RNase P/RNase MRP subunit p29
MRRQECVVRVVGISGSVADDTVAAVVLAAEVWTVPKPTSWNM